MCKQMTLWDYCGMTKEEWDSASAMCELMCPSIEGEEDDRAECFTDEDKETD